MIFSTHALICSMESEFSVEALVEVGFGQGWQG